MPALTAATVPTGGQLKPNEALAGGADKEKACAARTALERQLALAVQQWAPAPGSIVMPRDEIMDA